MSDPALTHRVPALPGPVPLDAPWDSDAWAGVAALELRHFMGDRPAHFPRVRARFAYDENCLQAIFHVEDRYVRAVAQAHQDMVCRDSCVEFFFTPGEDVTRGYLNLEMNCGGTMLLHYQREPRGENTPVAEQDLATIQVWHDLPRIVEPERTAPTTWSVAYRLPVALIDGYFPGEIVRPGPGARWRANVYKCGDETSHPHWLTWSPVAHPQPDFHRPTQFGYFEFV